MIIMNRRIVQEILPVIVIRFLNDWLLRVFILVSLFSQIELLLLGNRRKYTPGNWLRSIIWQAYATKDAIIDISIGVLFTCQGASEDNSSQQNDMMKAFWLAFLLLHLGGPDTITAYSLEDNELWRRHLIQLFLKSLWASSIFFRSWKGTPLNILTMLMFVPGLIKYGEKTWFLRSGSNDHLRDSIIRHRDRGHTDPTVVPSVSTPTGNPPTGNTPTGSPPTSSTLTTLTGSPWSPPTGCPQYPRVPLDRGPSCACATFMAGCNGLCCAAVMAEYDGVSYAAFRTECDCKKAEEYCVSCQPESEKSEVVNIPSPGPGYLRQPGTFARPFAKGY
ncbi:uncharacterized protein LOC117913782 [Vitis riparia]|uniref:uncharacterized protein LOC117913782 n=1 Tax=Vitis riparia TaxID=96939 RepID=UPI00155AA9BC|nr:uncharacterized protein LOC117913782 [Vitis riparia]XP_034684711.1 uncharacterized protein LOC117913782 [Vitis riparia]